MKAFAVGARRAAAREPDRARVVFAPWPSGALEDAPETQPVAPARLAGAGAGELHEPVRPPSRAIPAALGALVALLLLAGLFAWLGRGAGAARGSLALANAAGAAQGPIDLSRLPAEALRPTGVPVKRGDWVITKDYAAHGGLDPVSRQKWGAVDFAFWHDKDAFGAEIIATHAGRVKLLTDDPTYGNLVYVMGPHFTTTYGHMERFNVQEGQMVQRGDVIGFMGSTGASTGPHVDYQVWLDGQNQNPMDYCQCGMKGPDTPNE